jgi:hypothetical protein
MDPSQRNSGLNAPKGRCCLGPQCSNPKQELRDTHRCPGCSGHIHVLCGMFEEDYFPPGADKEKEKGKDVHFCPPCHEKRNNSISSPFVPPNADLNLLLNGSPDTPGRKRATPKRLAMNDDDTESKEVEDSPYSVDHPPNQHMETAFF